LSVPEIAVIAEGSKTFVYVVDKSGERAVAQKTDVQLAKRERGFVEVVGGLKAGDVVVTDGVMKLRPGAPVIVQQGAQGEGGNPRIAGGEGPSDRAGLRQ
jgi:membrane fusion protein (multidrug efflux system)